jgi:hypothetical protein
MLRLSKTRGLFSQTLSVSSSRRQRPKTRPALELLEARDLPSAVSGAVISGQSLVAKMGAPQCVGGHHLSVDSATDSGRYQTTVWSAAHDIGLGIKYGLGVKY